MNDASFRSRALHLVLGAVSVVGGLVVAGCNGVVTHGGGGEGGGGAGGDPGVSGGGGSVADGGPAIAMLYSELPDVDTGGTGSSSSGGPPVDPNTLYLAIGDQPIACVDPYAGQDCGGHWRVAFGIPQAMQVPGVIDLASQEVNAYFTATGPGSGPDCYWVGGSFNTGTLEIVSIDGDQIVGSLSGTDTFEFNANGPFTALRCF